MRHVLGLLLLLSLIIHASTAHSAPPAGPGGTDVSSDVVTTRHTITLTGSPLIYTARAGFIPILDEATREVHAKIFFVSYTVEPRRDAPPRPLTFFTSGGPGEPATLTDLGPRWFKGATADAPLPLPPYELVDNPDTWLGMTDLVLIDPVGSGYSRATSPDYVAEYYNPTGDAESVAQFMQRYLELYEPQTRRPIFLAGVSYGSIRSALIADTAPRHGIPLRGLILGASALAVQPRRARTNAPKGELPYTESDLTYIQMLPTFTATAFFHKKLPPELQRNFQETLEEAEAWAATEYPALLDQSDSLSGEKLAVAAAQMARLTGLSAAAITQHRLRFLPDAFLRELLGAHWTPVGLQDSRKTKAGDAGGANGPNKYRLPSLLYLSGELQFRTELPYDVGFLTYVKGWHCSDDTSNCVDPQSQASLQRAMGANPSLRVMITSGYYDLSCPYFGTKSVLSEFQPDLKARLNVVYYQSGHPLPPEHRLRVAAFIQNTLSQR